MVGSVFRLGLRSGVIVCVSGLCDASASRLGSFVKNGPDFRTWLRVADWAGTGRGLGERVWECALLAGGGLEAGR